jgi:hypothetical protein
MDEDSNGYGIIRGTAIGVVLWVLIILFTAGIFHFIVNRV